MTLLPYKISTGTHVVEVFMDCRSGEKRAARAFFEIVATADVPDHEAQASASAELWLTVAA
jgi:hypothetical protein